MDEKVVSNLSITKTKEINESYNSSYILYIIEYDGLFQQTVVPKTDINCEQQICLFKRRVSVFRRFSEFIALQKVLERNKSFKRLMKGIKKPSSIQITAQNLLAFAGSAHTRLDSSTVEFRRIYLQNYLKQLSNLRPIAESSQFQQFLAYGSDGSIAFVGPIHSLSSNIDKVLYNGVRGAIRIMKTALPVEAQMGKIDPKFDERVIPENEKLTIKSISTKTESNSCMQLEKKLNIWSESDFDVTLIDSKEREDQTFNQNLIDEETALTPTYLGTYLGTRTLGDGCEDPNHTEINLDDNETTITLNSNISIDFINCLILLMTTKIELIDKIIYSKAIDFFFGTLIERYFFDSIRFDPNLFHLNFIFQIIIRISDKTCDK